jgi:CO dehydrogenase maturation factor
VMSGPVRVMAVCGKGGVGKTTVAAVLARALRGRPGVKALIVDADPAGGLGLALGLSVKRSINEVRLATIADIRDGGSARREAAAGLDYRLTEAMTEHGNLAFLSLGRPEEAGCYCAVNTLLREAIELLGSRFDLTVIDAEAGLEQVSRKVMSRVDALVLVSDGSGKGLKTAAAVADAASRISGLTRAGLLLNRVRPEEHAEIQARASLPILGFIPEDDLIREADLHERSFFDLPECPAVRAIEAALAKAGVLTDAAG